MFNYIFNLIPSALLLGCNSKLFAGKLFSLYAPRIYLYEHSEIKIQVFLHYQSYLDKLEDYIDYIILELTLVSMTIWIGKRQA